MVGRRSTDSSFHSHHVIDTSMVDAFNLKNCNDFPHAFWFKFGRDGKTVYVRREFSNGSSIYSTQHVDDPGENDSLSSARSYANVRCPESLRYDQRDE